MKGTHDDSLDREKPSLPGGLPGDEEILGAIVLELLRSGRQISRSNICIQLAAQLERAMDPLPEAQYTKLLSLLLGSVSD